MFSMCNKVISVSFQSTFNQSGSQLYLFIYLAHCVFEFDTPDLDSIVFCFDCFHLTFLITTIFKQNFVENIFILFKQTQV